MIAFSLSHSFSGGTRSPAACSPSTHITLHEQTTTEKIFPGRLNLLSKIGIRTVYHSLLAITLVDKALKTIRQNKRLHTFVAYGCAIAKSTKNVQSYRLQDCVNGSSSIHDTPEPGHLSLLPNNSSLLLRPQHRLTDIRPREPHIRRLLQLQHDVHTGEVGACALQRRDRRDVHVRLRRQVLLRHRVALLVLELRAGAGECAADFFGDFFRGDGTVGAVDFSQALAFGVAACLLEG